MDVQIKRYRLLGLTEILGSQPAQDDIRSAYIISKNPDPYGTQCEEEMQTPDYDQGITVFLRDPMTNSLVIMEYVLKGFLKEAIGAQKKSLKVTNYKSKVDKLVFIEPRKLIFSRNGEPLLEEDSVNERVLRASTAQGPRTALVASEQIDTPWNLEFTLTLLANDDTKKSAALSFDTIGAALDYGRFCGIGQFRNGGFGRFTWEEIT